MKKEQTHKYIYKDEAEAVFYKLSDSFRNSYSDKTLLSGEAKNGESLSSIKFEQEESYGDLFYSVLLIGLSETSPREICQLIYEKRLELELQFFHFGKVGGVDHDYLIMNTMDWRDKDGFLCEVISLKNIKTNTIKEHWQ